MMRGNWPFFSRWPLTMASMMLGWSEPRLTKQWVMPASQMASKKANDAVYMAGDVEQKDLLLSGAEGTLLLGQCTVGAAVWTPWAEVNILPNATRRLPLLWPSLERSACLPSRLGTARCL